jgi:hypothetical protein
MNAKTQAKNLSEALKWSGSRIIIIVAISLSFFLLFFQTEKLTS